MELTSKDGNMVVDFYPVKNWGGDLITTEDDNGNDVLEDITEYEIYQVFQQLKTLNGGN